MDKDKLRKARKQRSRDSHSYLRMSTTPGPPGPEFRLRHNSPETRRTASQGSWRRRRQPSMPKMPWETEE